MQIATAVCIVFIAKNFKLEIFAFERNAIDCKIIDTPPNARIAEIATADNSPPINAKSLQPRVISIIPLEIPFASSMFEPNIPKSQDKK